MGIHNNAAAKSFSLYKLLGHRVMKVIEVDDLVTDLLVEAKNGEVWLARCDLKPEIHSRHLMGFKGSFLGMDPDRAAYIFQGSRTINAERFADSEKIEMIHVSSIENYLAQFDKPQSESPPNPDEYEALSNTGLSSRKAPEERICDKCGRGVDLDERWCHICGHRLSTGLSAGLPGRMYAEPTKQCPYCAEIIKLQAIACRYCGRNLTTTPADPPKSKARKESLSGGDALVAFIMPILGLIVSVFYLLKPQSRERGMSLVVVSLIGWAVWWVVCSLTGGF